MTECSPIFDPELSRETFGSNEGLDIDSRLLFYQLNQQNKKHKLILNAHRFLIQRFQELEQNKAIAITQDYNAENLSLLQSPKMAALPEALCTKDNLYKCIKQTTVIQLTQPCWLQNISQISSCQSNSAVQLTAVYLQLIDRKNSDLYDGLLLNLAINKPVLHHFQYSQDPEVLSELFGFSSTQLALSLFPRVFFAEILGFTLAYCQMPTLTEICFPKHTLATEFFNNNSQLLKSQVLPVTKCIQDYLELFPQHQQQLWQRVQHGYWLYQSKMHSCSDQLHQSLSDMLSPQQAVAQLFHQKVSAAMGHHHKITLQGQALDQWFSQMPDNNAEFLQALKQSHYVDKARPLESRLLKLFAFNGPMFGVLNQHELQVLQDWLLDGSRGSGFYTDIKQAKVISVPIEGGGATNYASLSNKELYYYLVNADLFPDVLPSAQIKAKKLLQWTRLLSPLPFKHYSHQQFDGYIEKIYQKEMQAYKPLQSKPKISRAAYIYGIEQIAPMILIDGCWLQNMQSVKNTSPEISDILFAIYCDEIGNGQLVQNHPYIFQKLLDSLDISVPPVHSADFIKHTGFINSAFDLPVFMLAMSCYSTRFLPELLGLNMAIELSGLGKSYMQLVDDWEYWQIDPTIAKIHISIDNYASGHTFLAKKSIHIYMDDLLQATGDAKVLDQHWRRIYTGYASLRCVGARFKLSLPIHYFLRKFLK